MGASGYNSLPQIKRSRSSFSRVLWYGRIWLAVTGGMTEVMGLRYRTNGTAPTPPVNPTLNRTNIGVVTFIGRFGRHATGRTNFVVPIRVAICRSHSFAFVAGAPPTTILLGGTTNLSGTSNRPGGGGMTGLNHSGIHRVTAAGVPSLGTGSIRTTVGVVRNATHDVNVRVISWFSNSLPIRKMAHWAAWKKEGVTGMNGGCTRTTGLFSGRGRCSITRTVSVLGGVSATGFSRAIRLTMGLGMSPGCTSRRIHNTLMLPRNANGSGAILMFTRNSGRGRTLTTNTSCINTSSLMRGVGNN